MLSNIFFFSSHCSMFRVDRAGGAERMDYGKINILAGIYSNEKT